MGPPLTLPVAMNQAKPTMTTHREGARDLTREAFLTFLRSNKRRFEAHLRLRLRQAQRRFPRVGAPTIATTQGLVELCERGGKRVRPGLVLSGALCVNEAPPTDCLFDAAAALELLHGYFLVHDDWMDGDLLRRGGPSVHAALRKRFGNDHLGDAAAILAGDWGVAVATEWMARLDVDGKTLKAALSCFAEMQLAAVVGQVRDLLAVDDDVELTYRLKTASYTVSGPLLLGAILGCGTPAQLKSIAQFALPIGVAFQLRDDSIGVFGSPEATGKPFASDIRAGKRTAIVLESLRLATPAEGRFLRRILGNPMATDKDLKRFVRLLESTGAKKRVENRIATLYRRGMKQLAGAKLRSEGKLLLASAAAALVNRNA